LRENLLEEMGHSEDEPPHSALLLKLAEGVGFTRTETERLVDDARRQVSLFCASRVPLATLREICLAVLLETMSFEFMLSRCSSQIHKALRQNYGIPQEALKWFELHSEVDIRHAEEGLTVISDYLDFHGIGGATFDLIQRNALADVFNRHYFPAPSRAIQAARRSTRASTAIDALTVYRLKIPFRQTFTHATQARDDSDAIIVKLSGANGETGYGEALPRPYVTGESTDTMITRVRERLAPEVLGRSWTPGWPTFDELARVLADWTASQSEKVASWNAAFCAVELALIDWSLKSLRVSLTDFLPPSRNEVVYSGVISADSPGEAAALAKRMVKLGIRQIKVKVGTLDDAARIAAIRQAAGERVELRGDANGAWTTEQALAQLKALQPYKLAVIEQPVAADDFNGLKRVHEETGIAVMADESLITLEHARKLIEQRACGYFNIRLSKNGGITGSLAIAKLAQQAGMKIQVGAQVGETGILSAAGRAFAAHLPEIAFAEGSFGTWLLTEDITFEDVAFGYGGIAPLLRTRGLSVTVKEDILERLALEKIELRR
jgi:muconate cycloisomerase